MPTIARVSAKTIFEPAAKALLLHRLGSIQPGSQRLWGRMTAHQMVCHLSDTFRFALGERPAASVSTPVSRTVLRWVALHTPLPWPKGRAKTFPEADQEIGETRPSEFAQDLEELRRLIERFATSEGRFDGLSHPIFGPMSAEEWGRWAYRHVDHHLRQLGA